MKRALEPSLSRYAAQLKRKAANHRPRNSDGTFKRVSTKPTSNTAPPAAALPPALFANGQIVRVIGELVREICQWFWPPSDPEMGIKRGYLDSRDGRK